MYQEPVKLDRLPIETLRRIASLGACEAALALSKVNRTLYAACNDRLVFKAIIDNRNGYGGPKWHHHLPLSMESPVSSWARYALADSKAAQDRSSSLDPERIAPWVPHLVVYHHPLVNIPKALLTLTVAFNPTAKETTDSMLAVVFCFASGLMCQKPAGDLGPQWPQQMPSPIDLIPYLNKPLYLFPLESSDLAVYSPTILMQKRLQALTAVGVLSVMLRETMSLGHIRRLPSGLDQTDVIAVPTLTEIPLHLMMEIPLPFSPTSNKNLASCHLAKMATAEFLEDGEWAGFYSMPQARVQSIVFDPPMHRIRLSATPDHNSSHLLHVQGTGEDGIGSFDLYGEIIPQTGQICLRKEYSGGSPVWDWVCMITPFGIVGCWGRRIHRHYGGWVWLWKVSWTASRIATH